MSQLIGRFQKTADLILVTAIVLVMPLTCWASITGSISGIITDPQGAVVPNVSVVVTCQETKIVTTVATDSKRFYSFPVLAVSTYDIVVAQNGFKKYDADGIKINSNSSVRTDISLSLGSAIDTVTVESNPLQVETQNTQMGEVIESRKITEIPLNCRSFIDLLALQPGVAPYQATAFTTGTGIGANNTSGNLSDGQQSMNGERPGSNGYMVNGVTFTNNLYFGGIGTPRFDSHPIMQDPPFVDAPRGDLHLRKDSVANLSGSPAVRDFVDTAYDLRKFSAGKYHEIGAYAAK